MTKKMSQSKRIRVLYSQADPNHKHIPLGKIAVTEVNSLWDVKQDKETGKQVIRAADGSIKIAFDVWVE